MYLIMYLSNIPIVTLKIILLWILITIDLYITLDFFLRFQMMPELICFCFHSIYLPIGLSIYPSICLSIRLSIYLSLSLSFFFVCLSLYFNLCLSLCRCISLFLFRFRLLSQQPFSHFNFSYFVLSLTSSYQVSNRGLNHLIDRLSSHKDPLLLKIIRNISSWTFEQQQVRA